MIARLRKEGMTQKGIAYAVGFSQSAVSKELSRNARDREYCPKYASEVARSRQLGKRRRASVMEGNVLSEVEGLLTRDHSPEQICGAMRLRGFGPSHETIYRHILRDRGLGGSLYTHLRINGRRKKMRRRRVRNIGGIPNRVGIEQRPAAADNRLRYGDWEADLMSGRWINDGYLLTLFERKSRVGLIERVSSKSSAEVSAAIKRRLQGMKVRSITYDNGGEFANHASVSEFLGSEAYFCLPYHSWEKGAVENFNGLVRQYVPKGAYIREISDRRIEEIELQLNQRPRKVLGFKRPIQYINKIAL